MTPARQVTEPFRPIAANALLIGNGVFLFIGLSDLLFVVDGWASGFGTRSVGAFDAFAGPFAVALPLLAVLIATHVGPTLPKARIVLLGALGSYAFSAVFGVITYLGAFAGSLFSVRDTFDGLLWRSVWLCFLAIAGMAVYRVYQADVPGCATESPVWTDGLRPAVPGPAHVPSADLSAGHRGAPLRTATRHRRVRRPHRRDRVAGGSTADGAACGRTGSHTHG